LPTRARAASERIGQSPENDFCRRENALECAERLAIGKESMKRFVKGALLPGALGAAFLLGQNAGWAAFADFGIIWVGPFALNSR
jgi:hypothetical protein